MKNYLYSKFIQGTHHAKCEKRVVAAASCCGGGVGGSSAGTGKLLLIVEKIDGAKFRAMLKTNLGRGIFMCNNSLDLNLIGDFYRT